MSEQKKPELALVTGSSSGIGERIAERLAASGRNLVLVARSESKLKALAERLSGAHGVSCTVIPADLSAPGAAAALKAECERRGLAPDILVNNAGAGLFGSAIAQDPAAVEAMLRLNASSLAELCRRFGADMAKRGRGRIMNVSSMASLMPLPYNAAYAASKAFVTSYSEALRAELRKRGVSVTCLLPGYVRTNFDAAASVTDEKYLKSSAAMGMDPDKVARIGVRALLRGRGTVVAGAMNALGAFFIRMIPRALLARLSAAYLGGIFDAEGKEI